MSFCVRKIDSAFAIEVESEFGMIVEQKRGQRATLTALFGGDFVMIAAHAALAADGAGALLTTLFALQRANPGINTRNVLALHVPVNYERPPEQTLPLYREAIRRISELPGVEQVAVGTLVPWREAGAFFAPHPRNDFDRNCLLSRALGPRRRRRRRRDPADPPGRP